MKTAKRILTWALAVALVLSLTGVFALAVEDDEPVKETRDDVTAITVSVRIEGQTENLFYNTAVRLVPVGEEPLTVLDLATILNESETAPDFTFKDSGYGPYITAIGDLEEGTNAEWDGWQFRVNGISPVVGISAYELADGDSVVFYYSDEFGMGFAFPEIDLTNIYNGNISFTTTVTTYDDEGTPSTAVVPVADAVVTIGDDTRTTDENGTIALNVFGGFRTLQIEKTDAETGIPLVLRLAPDYEIFVPFTDTEEGAWYDEAIQYNVKSGLFKGNQDGTFNPDGNMTLAELTQVLYRVADGVDVVGAEFWYTGALNWAVESGLFPEESFKPDVVVQRQQFIFLFNKTIEIVGERDIEARADLTEATDYDDISGSYLEAVEWAVASGLINGTSEETLTINPKGTITRAEVCKMLQNYYTAV
ncbi:MAG: S-layer homology domain-containing protein [Oscillospiraceae bacterium]|jgi:hypothetical protein|nr:S-layer homology domain-containing protein [Oscillospiraceae bacterium]